MTCTFVSIHSPTLDIKALCSTLGTAKSFLTWLYGFLEIKKGLDVALCFYRFFSSLYWFRKKISFLLKHHRRLSKEPLKKFSYASRSKTKLCVK